MSDAPQGPGWWQASDGQWYAPEQAPGFQAPVGGQPAMAGAGGGNMMMGTPDIGAALSYGWNKFLANIGNIVIIWLIVIAVNVVFNGLSRTTSSVVLSLVISIIGFLASMIVQIALIRVGLLITSGQVPTPAAAFSTERLAPFVIASLLYGVGIALGLVVLCIGALIVAFLGYFYGYYVLDQNQEPIDSLKSSFQLTSKNFGTVGLFSIVAILLSICTCGLATPFVQIATAYMYRTLNGQPVAV